MSDLRDLYQEVILDHSKHPRNKGGLINAEYQALGNNPLCGDKLTLFLNFKNGVVSEVSFEGSGCAISMASASLLTEMIKGKTSDEIEKIFHAFHHLVTSDQPLPEGSIDLDKLLVFDGVRDYPARVKCASLSWHTIMAALKNKKEISTE